jgi:hypothetical protein
MRFSVTLLCVCEGGSRCEGGRHASDDGTPLHQEYRLPVIHERCCRRTLLWPAACCCAMLRPGSSVDCCILAWTERRSTARLGSSAGKDSMWVGAIHLCDCEGWSSCEGASGGHASDDGHRDNGTASLRIHEHWCRPLPPLVFRR